MPVQETRPAKKRLSQSHRKHIRRLKAEARKTGVPYVASLRLVSTPKVVPAKVIKKDQ